MSEKGLSEVLPFQAVFAHLFVKRAPGNVQCVGDRPPPVATAVFEDVPPFVTSALLACSVIFTTPPSHDIRFMQACTNARPRH